MRNHRNRVLLSLRVTALVFGGLIALTFIVFLIGEAGYPPLFRLQRQAFTTWCLALWFFSLLVALKWPGAGGLTGIVGVAGFYFINYSMSGRFPGGPVFPTLWIPPALLLIYRCLDNNHNGPEVEGKESD